MRFGIKKVSCEKLNSECGEGGSRKRARSGLGDRRAVELELPDLGQQRWVAEAQIARGARLVPAIALERLGDHLPLELCHVVLEDTRRGARGRGGLANLGRQQAGAE